MTTEQRKLIFDYMEWRMPCNGKHESDCITEDDKYTCRTCEFYHPLDGNDMVAVMNRMVERGDWLRFRDYAWLKCPDEKIDADNESDTNALFEVWLFLEEEHFCCLAAELMRERNG